MSIRKVVAATDFSFSAHRAARRAGAIARELGAALHLFHVIDSSTGTSLLRRSPELDLQQSLRSGAQRGLDSLAEDVRAAGGVVSDTLLREGSLTEEILALSASSDLFVFGPRGVNPLRTFFLGSTAERIARLIECPMLVVKQDPQIRYENVLVPVDFSDYSMPSLRFASELAPSAILHVFHALDWAIESRLRSAGLSSEAIKTYTEEIERDANANMSQLTAGLGVRAVRGTVQTGDARVSIIERAAESQCTLIVMGKQGRSWLSERILGSVTRQVLERAECDVVVVPHG